MEELRSAKDKKQKSRLNDNSLGNYAKYSGLAFQMGAIIAVTVWGGVKFDELMENDKPVFAIIFSLLGVLAAIYTAIKDFIKK